MEFSIDIQKNTKSNSQLTDKPRKKVHADPKTGKSLIPKPKERVQLSKQFKGQFIEIEKNYAKGFKGYLSVLSTYPICEGVFYFEIKYAVRKESGHIRVGIANSQFNPELPLGYDTNSYCINDEGIKIHNGIRTKYCEPFNEGDCIGCLIQILPPKPKAILADLNVEGVLLEGINQGSQILFFKNGKLLGLAFQDLIQEFYYMGCSLYMGAEVEVNFGPQWKYPPELSDSNLTSLKESFQPAYNIAKLNTPYEFKRFS